MRYHGNKICQDEWTNERTDAADGQPKNTMLLPTLPGGKGIKITGCRMWSRQIIDTKAWQQSDAKETTYYELIFRDGPDISG